MQNMQYLKLNKNKTFGFILNDKVSIFFIVILFKFNLQDCPLN